MERDNSERQAANQKFQSCQLVRIKTSAEMKDPGPLIPADQSMGKSGIVEMGGMVYVSGPEKSISLKQGYFVRVDGIGPVLTGEDWLEDAEPLR